MKKLYQLFLLSSIYFIGNCIVACSSDSNDDIQTPENNLPEASKAFVGYWEDNSSTIKAVDFLFYADGTGKMWNDYNSVLTEGYWTFNETTSILATTMNSWQFEVTLSNADAWAGISLGSATSKNYSRGSNFEAIKLILKYSSWKADSQTLNIFKYLSGTIVPDIPDKYMNATECGYILSMYEDDITDDFRIKYKLSLYSKYYNKDNSYRDYWEDKGYGTITIENPYMPSKTKIILTGSLDGTLKLCKKD